MAVGYAFIKTGNKFKLNVLGKMPADFSASEWKSYESRIKRAGHYGIVYAGIFEGTSEYPHMNRENSKKRIDALWAFAEESNRTQSFNPNCLEKALSEIDCNDSVTHRGHAWA